MNEQSFGFKDILDEVRLAFEAGLITPEQIATKLKLPVWLVRYLIWRVTK
jgi:hypothetical protein